MRSHSDGVRSDVYRIPMLIGESESLYNCKMHDLSSFNQRSHFLNRLLDRLAFESSQLLLLVQQVEPLVVTAFRLVRPLHQSGQLTIEELIPQAQRDI